MVSYISQTCNKTIKIRQTCNETKEDGDPRDERKEERGEREETEERKDKREKRQDMDIYLFFSHMWHGWVHIKGIFYLKVGLLMFVLFL